MHTKLGVKISPNALVKRYQKTLDSFLLVSLYTLLNAHACLPTSLTYLPNCYCGDGELMTILSYSRSPRQRRALCPMSWPSLCGSSPSRRARASSRKRREQRSKGYDMICRGLCKIAFCGRRRLCYGERSKVASGRAEADCVGEAEYLL